MHSAGRSGEGRQPSVLFDAQLLDLAVERALGHEQLGGGFAALTLVITPLVTFAAAAVGFACYVLSRLVLDAAVLREENDMTI